MDNLMGSSPGSCYIFPSGYPLRAGLHWDDWSAVDQDYDLHLVRRIPSTGNTFTIVASSIDYQNGGSGQTPEEYISYTADGVNCYAWVVERWDSNRDVCLRAERRKTLTP